MATLSGLTKGVTKDPTPPATDTVVSPITISDGTTLVTTKTTNETIDNVDQLIDYVSGDVVGIFIPQLAIEDLVSDLAAKEDSLGFTPENIANKVITIGTPGDDTNYPTEQAVREALDLKEDSLGFTPENIANKGAVSGYAGLDATQELLLANFPSGAALQVLRRDAGNTALEFAAAGAGDMILADIQTVTGAKTFEDTNFFLRNVADTFSASFVNTITANRIYTLPDAAGTVVITGLASQITLGTEVTGASTDLTDTANIARDSDNLGFFAATTSAQLLGVISDETGTGLLVFGTSPTIVTPTIASFVNATHDHEAAAGGGTLLSTAALSDTANIAYLNTANTFGAFLQDFAASSMRIPLSATPTMAVDGDFAIDTLVTDFSHGIIKYFDGEELGVVSMPIAQFTTPTDGDVIAYNATNDEFELVTGGGGTGDVVGPASNLVNQSIVVFDGVTGKLIKESGSSSLTPTIDVAGNFQIPRAVNFTLDSTAGTAGLAHINHGLSNFFINAPTGNAITLTIQATVEYSFDATGANWNNNTLNNLGNTTFSDGSNIIFNTTTGTKIGTATNQLIGFWNATPVVQPAHIADPSGGATVDAEARTAINSILSQLASTGLQASS